MVWCSNDAMAKRGVPAEGACFEPGNSRFEASLGGGSTLFVGELGLRSERLYMYTVREYGQKRMGCNQGFEFWKWTMYRSICGGMINMFGETP